VPTTATANLGGGGGGGGVLGNGGNGGSGVVILSYVTADYAVTNTNGSVTTDGANTVVTFTSTGTFTIPASSGGFFNFM